MFWWDLHYGFGWFLLHFPVNGPLRGGIRICVRTKVVFCFEENREFIYIGRRSSLLFLKLTIFEDFSGRSNSQSESLSFLRFTIF